MTRYSVIAIFEHCEVVGFHLIFISKDCYSQPEQGADFVPCRTSVRCTTKRGTSAITAVTRGSSLSVKSPSYSAKPVPLHRGHSELA